MAHMQDPSIRGELYQQGPQYGYENIKAYVLARDGYTCQVCRQKNKDLKLHVHHILFRSEGATDNPKYMVTVCKDCHTPEAHQPGGILYEWKQQQHNFNRGLRDATQMNIVADRLRKAFPDAQVTYGNITNADRKELGLEKSHANDAVAIACHGTGITKVEDSQDTLYIQQQRKKKRSLHEANPRKGRKEPNRGAKRNTKNVKKVTIQQKLVDKEGKKTKVPVTYCLLDKVKIGNRIGWITGFTGQSARVQDKNGKYITVSDKYTQISLSKMKVLKHNNNWLIGPMTQLAKQG